jgi:DNA (cytosine-5)-methyltransferase 1
MKFGSLFSGVGGFDLAFERAGMSCAWQCEIDPKASAVLARHWPGVPNIGDVRDVRAGNVEPVDLVCGGFPCQDLSVAGKRAGLAGKRSGLWFEFARVIDELEPRWVVAENVPGLLSSDRGRDFAVIVQWLAERGYGVAWRVLDAQYFGVAQRRRRVFIVASFGSGRAAEVLFEREGVRWNPPPRREAGQGFAAVAGTLSANRGGTERPAGNANELDFCVPIGFAHTSTVDPQDNVSPAITLSSGLDIPSPPMVAYGGNNTSGPIDVATACNAHGGTGRHDFESETFIAFNARRTEIGAIENLSPTLNPGNGGSQSPGVAWDLQQITSRANRSQPKSEYSPTLNKAGQMMVGVRRLTPLECERLQGFPDGWTDGQADSARYRQMGNAVAVPVVEWIGRRITELTAWLTEG